MTFDLQAYLAAGAKCKGNDDSLVVLCQDVDTESLL